MKHPQTHPIGQLITMLEAHRILATIASGYQLRLMARYMVKSFATITCNPQGRLHVTVHKC